MHVICLCYPCTLLNSSCMQQQGERASERADRTWTNGRTNQPTWTNEPTNQRTNEPTWNETNQRICNKAQHSTALRGDRSSLTHLTDDETKKNPISPNATSPSPVSVPSFAYRLPLTPTLVGRGEERRGGTCDCATVRKYCMTMRCPWPYTRLKCINDCA